MLWNLTSTIIIPSGCFAFCSTQFHSNTDDLYFVKSRLISVRAEISGFADCVGTQALDR